MHQLPSCEGTTYAFMPCGASLSNTRHAHTQVGIGYQPWAKFASVLFTLLLTLGYNSLVDRVATPHLFYLVGYVRVCVCVCVFLCVCLWVSLCVPPSRTESPLHVTYRRLLYTLLFLGIASLLSTHSLGLQNELSSPGKQPRLACSLYTHTHTPTNLTDPQRHRSPPASMT
jgi:hypothetical protein